MEKETVSVLSGILVSIGIFPYAWRIWRREITVNLLSWFVWLIASYAVLVNYKASGAEKNMWPAAFGCFNVTLVFVVALFRSKREKLQWYEWVCFVLGMASLAMWIIFETPGLLQYLEKFTGPLGTVKQIATLALCLSILADAFPAVITLLFLIHKPWEDRPFAWVTFATGYALNMFAITEHTFANYVLPIYMSLMAFGIAMPLIVYRIKNKISLKEWI